MFNLYIYTMKVGDKVRMLKDTIQGVVIKVIDNEQVEIEDDLGFGMPVLVKDLVLVSPLEDKYFGEGEKSINTTTTVAEDVQDLKATKGLYFSVVEEHKNYAIYLSNNTTTKHFVNLFSKKGTDYKNLYFDVLNTKTSVRVGLYPLSDIDSWNSVFMGFQARSSGLESFSQVSKKLDLTKLKKSPQSIPLVEKKGLCIQIDNDFQVDKVDLEHVINDSSAVRSQDNKSNLVRPKSEVDLHSEALGLSEELEDYEILTTQLRAFEKSLESAIAYAMPSITFIHGIGNGKLRMEIHKRIKNYPEVKYFEDANQTRFGYGATKVVLN